MDKPALYRGYCGELHAPCDSGLNPGAAWFAWKDMRAIKPNSQERAEEGEGHVISALRHHRASKLYEPRFHHAKMTTSGFLGMGGFGKVWRGSFGSTGTQYAIKQIASNRRTEDLWKERDFLIKLKGPRVVNLIGCFHDGDFFMVMELCYASLSNVLHKLHRENKIRFTIQLGEAIQWVHQNSIVHCDIRPDNILITSSNNLVLCDFGNAMYFEPGTVELKSPDIRGMPGYQDYESNMDFTYSKSSDMFSIACTLFEIWVGTYLMKKKNETKEMNRIFYATMYKEGRLDDFDPKKPPSSSQRPLKILLSERIKKIGVLFEIMCKLIAVRSERMTADQFLNHNIIKGLHLNFEVRNWKLENGDDYVVKECISVDIDRPYRRLHPNAKPEVNAALTGIYYDENEAPAGEHFRMALNSYEVHVVAKTFVEHNLVDRLIHDLARKDPDAFGLLENLVSGFIGRPFDAAEKSKSNQTLGTQAEEKSDQAVCDHRHSHTVPVPSKELLISDRMPAAEKDSSLVQTKSENAIRIVSANLDKNATTDDRTTTRTSQEDKEKPKNIKDIENTLGVFSMPDISGVVVHKHSETKDGEVNVLDDLRLSDDDGIPESQALKKVIQQTVNAVVLDALDDKKESSNQQSEISNETSSIPAPSIRYVPIKTTPTKKSSHSLPPTLPGKNRVINWNSRGKPRLRSSTLVTKSEPHLLNLVVQQSENILRDEPSTLSGDSSVLSTKSKKTPLTFTPVNESKSVSDGQLDEGTEIKHHEITKTTVLSKRVGAKSHLPPKKPEETNQSSTRKSSRKTKKTANSCTDVQEKEEPSSSRVPASTKSIRHTNKNPVEPKKTTDEISRKKPEPKHSPKKRGRPKATTSNKPAISKESNVEAEPKAVASTISEDKSLNKKLSDAVRNKSRKRAASQNDDNQETTSSKKLKPSEPIKPPETTPIEKLFKCSFCGFANSDKKRVQKCQKQCRLKERDLYK